MVISILYFSRLVCFSHSGPSKELVSVRPKLITLYLPFLSLSFSLPQLLTHSFLSSLSLSLSLSTMQTPAEKGRAGENHHLAALIDNYQVIRDR